MSLLHNDKNILLTEELVLNLLPKRNKTFHKGSCGHAVLFTGSEKYPGAGLLASEAALYTGAGYVSLFAPKDVTTMALTRTPSILAVPYENIYETRKEAETRADAILIGSGLGETENLYKLIEHLLTSKGCPVILDADAINILTAKRKENGKKRKLFKKKPSGRKLLKKAKREILLTPHLEEFSRISGVDGKKIEENREAVVSKFAKSYKVNVLLKGDHSLIVDKTGKIYENTTGSVALAKAGSGDVLAGAIVSFAASLAKNGVALDSILPNAAILGAFFHGKAGDEIEKTYSIYGLATHNLPCEIAKVMADSIAKSGVSLLVENSSALLEEISPKKDKKKKEKTPPKEKKAVVVPLVEEVTTQNETIVEEVVESEVEEPRVEEPTVVEPIESEVENSIEESTEETIVEDESVEISDTVEQENAIQEEDTTSVVEEDDNEIPNPIEATNDEENIEQSGAFF